MAVDVVSLMWSNNGASIASADRKKATLEQTDVYQVTVTTPTTTRLVILSHEDIPKIGARLGETSFIFCRSVEPVKITPIYWLVTVKWSGDVSALTVNGNPLNAPPELTWSDVETAEATDEDFDGNPIVTANNEPITGVTIPIVDQILTVKRNFASINTFAIAPYRQSTNSDLFAGWAPGTVRLIRYQATVKNSTSDVQNIGPSPQDGAYWEVNAAFQFRYPYRTTNDKAWYARVRHEGMYVKDSEGRITRATVSGADATKPVLLKEDGTRELDPTNAHWLEFKRLGSLPYNLLGMFS